MQVCQSVKSLRETIAVWKKQGLRVAFVPTMGNLHAGHLSLVKQAKELADKVVVSIFVNPLQFGENEDFDKYPRTLESDIQQLTKINADLVFTPNTTDIYPQKNDLNNQTKVTPLGTFSANFEGKIRLGHFEGVTTVVNKLFNMVQPDVAVFGQKDYQQWLVLRQMVTDFCMPIEMVCAQIEREQDGLALSSRNQYLTDEQRVISPTIYQTLLVTKQGFLEGLSIRELEERAITSLLSAGFDSVDYFAILDADTLETINDETKKPVVLTVARLGKTRLLDNLLINLKNKSC